MRKSRTITLAIPFASLLVASAAFANAGDFTAQLDPVPHDATADGGSEVTGTATMRLNGRNLVVDLHAEGLTPGEPHAMHIHGAAQAENECPTADDDTGTGDVAFADPTHDPGTPDGLVSLSEGAPDYGPVVVSFTKEGEPTGADVGLDVPRFLAADSEGNLDYQRTIMIPQDVAKNLTSLHIVLHGADLPMDDDSSSLSSFFEATLPVACGEIE